MKIYLFTALGFLVLAIGLILTFIVAVTDDKPINPLDYPVPQQIINNRIFSAGEEFEVYRLKCNTSDKSVSVLGNSDWRRTDLGFTNAIPYRSSIVPLVIPAKGCDERRGLNKIPESLSSGTWILEGVDCIVPEKTLCRPWYTDEFEVR